MWGTWTLHLTRRSQPLQLADEMMALAEREQDRGMLMEAWVTPAVTRFYRVIFPVV